MLTAWYDVSMPKRKDPAAVALGRKGGKARLKTMTPAERSTRAADAANARWSKAKALTGLLSDMPCDLSFDEIIEEEVEEKP